MLAGFQVLLSCSEPTAEPKMSKSRAVQQATGTPLSVLFYRVRVHQPLSCRTAAQEVTSEPATGYRRIGHLQQLHHAGRPWTAGIVKSAASLSTAECANNFNFGLVWTAGRPDMLATCSVATEPGSLLSVGNLFVVHREHRQPRSRCAHGLNGGSFTASVLHGAVHGSAFRPRALKAGKASCTCLCGTCTCVPSAS